MIRTANPPSAAILEYLDKNKVDLVVLSSSGRHGFERMILGSTAEQVLRNAACPVLLVPAHATKKSA